jgi:hypothetical protein
MIYLRLLWAIVSYSTFIIVKTATLDVLGLVLTPINIWAKRPALWLWWNDEDGPDPQWWKDRNPTWSEFKRQYVWLAVRNRTDNLQFTWFCPPPVPGKVEVDYFPHGGFICWQGWRCYVWTPLPKWVPFFQAISFGWNYYPTDAAPLEPGDIRRKGCGFGGRLTPKVA